MGLDASVRCRCWEEGKASLPPFADAVRLDEENHVILELPWDGNEESHLTFEKWMKTCCPHPEMEYARERISNWGGYRLFRDKLAEIGWDHFPTLKRELPEVNGGLTSAEASAEALAELDRFEARVEGSVIVVLVNATTGHVVQDYVPAYKGFFFWGGRAGIDMGVDERGFFIVEGKPRLFGLLKPRERFRSMSFMQRRLRESAFTFEDVQTRVSFTARAGVGETVPWPDGRMENDAGEERREYPEWLRVEERQVAAKEFQYILKPLRSVFRASAETGNPVRWA